MRQYPDPALLPGTSTYPGSFPDVTVGPALIPSLTTLPGSVSCGQGPYPLFRAFVSFDDVSTPVPSWVDVSARLRSLQATRGRISEVADWDAGTLTAVLDNRDNFLVPQVNARPMNRIRIREEFAGDVQDVFTGYTEAWQSTWDQSGMVDQLMTLTASDETKRLVRSSISLSLGSGTATTQANAILDASGSTATRKYVSDNSMVYPPRTITAQASSDALKDESLMQLPQPAIASTLISRHGEVLSLGGFYRHLEGYNVPVIVLTDSGDGTYTGLVTDYSDAFLANSITTTFADSSSAQQIDWPSVNRYGFRTASYSIDANPDGGWALARLSAYSQPMLRVTSLVLKTSKPDVAAAAFRLDLLSPVRVIRSFPGGSIDQLSYVQRIECQAIPGIPPTVTLGLSPL